jgi:hypothetical protein
MACVLHLTSDLPQSFQQAVDESVLLPVHAVGLVVAARQTDIPGEGNKNYFPVLLQKSQQRQEFLQNLSCLFC